MGSLTLASARTELTGLLRSRTNTYATDEDRQNRWLNDGYIYMCHPSIHKFREVQVIDNSTTLVTGTNEYSISNATLGFNVVATRFVTHIEATSYVPTARRRKIYPRSINWFEERTMAGNTQPSVYTIDGETLFVSGVPGATENGQILRVGFWREPVELTADDAATVFSRYYDRPWLKMAVAFAEADIGDKALALTTLREAEGLLNGAGEEQELEAGDTGWQSEFTIREPHRIL